MERYTIIVCTPAGQLLAYPDMDLAGTENVVSDLKSYEQIGPGRSGVERGEFMVIRGEVLRPGPLRRALHQFHGWAKNIVARFRIGNYHRIPGSIDRMSTVEAEEWYRLLQQLECKLANAERTPRSFPSGPRLR